MSRSFPRPPFVFARRRGENIRVRLMTRQVDAAFPPGPCYRMKVMRTTGSQGRALEGDE